MTEYFLRIYRSGAEKFDKLHLPWLAKCIFITNWELSAFQNLEKLKGIIYLTLEELSNLWVGRHFQQHPTVYLSFAFFNREGLEIIQVTIKCFWQKIS